MKSFCMIAASTIALMSAASAHAQSTVTTDQASEADGGGAADDSTDQEIVVTAERRSTSLQRTGVAATVLTGEDLTRKAVNGVEQLQFASPSLTVNTAGQGNAFNIRGIGKTEQTSAIGVGVVTYRDGVATFPGYLQTDPYYDIASVEVLRGPQGTFAGGNATGGAVFITQQNPTLDRVGGYVMGQYGNYDNIKLQGAVNLPISDTFAIRAAGNMERRDTFYKMSGPWTGNPGNRRDWSGRLSALWQPTSQFRVLLKGDYSNIEYGGLPASRAYTITGPAASPTITTNTADPLLVSSDAFLNGRDEFGRIVLNVSYETNGGITLRSISGYQKGTTQINSDIDGSATVTPALSFRDKISERIWSQEFNIISPDAGPFTWVLGGYYQHDKITIPPNGGYYSDATPNAIPSALDIEIVGVNPKTALAAFGQIGYELTNGLQVTAGARWSRTTSANDAVARAIVDNVGVPITPVILLELPQKDKTVNKNVDWKVALNWTVNPQHFFYAFVATGTKAGGLNGPNVLGRTPLAFDAETLTDFEAGWKGTFMDGHLRMQVGGYYNIYKNFQINIADPRGATISSIYNVPGKTKLYGIEISAQGNFDALQIDMSASISNSKLGTFYAIDPRIPVPPATPLCNPETGPGTARCVNLAGNEQNYAPKFTFTAGIQYAIPLGDDMTLTPRVDYSHIGATWGSLFQDSRLGDRLEARNIVNAQLNLGIGDWTMGGYATNLTNQHYVGAINGFRRLAGAPRQYGLRVTRRF